MRLLHKEKSGARRIPKPVQEYLRRRFMLPSPYVDELRCIETDRVVHDELSKWVRVFSPSLARSRGAEIRNSSDLDQYPGVLLFEGYVRSDGQVHMADRRPPRLGP